MSNFDINNPRIIEREKRDYETTKSILTKIFHNFNLEFKQMEAASVSDMRLKVYHKDGEITFFNIEIKSRNCCLEDCDGLPLTVKKYCNLKDDTQSYERLIYVSLVNDEDYFIFDLDRVDMNKVVIENWLINDIEYAHDGQVKKKIPTMFFPLNLACYNGNIPKRLCRQ